MRQLLCTLCLVAVVGIIALTGENAQASASTPVNTIAPASATAAPSVLDRWAFISLLISFGALGIALSGTSRHLELRPILGMAGEHAQRFVQHVARATASSVAGMTAGKQPSPPAPAIPAATDTAALEALMESIGSRYLNDLQSLHSVVEQAWANEVNGRDERIQALMRQIERLEHERDLLAEKVCDLERAQSASTSALVAARDDLERRLSHLDRQISTATAPAQTNAAAGQSASKRRTNNASRPSRGRRGKGGR